MGRFPLMRLGVLCDLWSQVRFQPAASAARQMERAEGLLDSLDDDAVYPWDFVVFRVTGYRPEGGGGEEEGGGVLGSELRCELPFLIERLSVLAQWSPDDEVGVDGGDDARVDGGDGGGGGSGGWLGVEDVMLRWGVSRSTFGRLRRLGLSGRRVRGDGGVGKGRGSGASVLLFSEVRVAAFERVHGERIRRAGGFSRMGADEEARLIGLARRYRARLGWSLHRTAERLAERSGRSVEGVRGLLLRHEGVEGCGVVGGNRRGGSGGKGWGRVAHRAWLRGLDVAELAERWGETGGAVRRGVVRERARLVRGWADWLVSSGGVSGGAGVRDGVVVDVGVDGLVDGVVCAGLFGPVPVRVLDLIEVGMGMGGPRVERECALVGARVVVDRCVVVGAGRLVGRGNVRATEVDDLEVLLRWSALLRLELMRDQVGLLVRAVSDWGGRPAVELGGLTAHAAFRAGLLGLSSAAGRFDGERGGRFAGAAGLAVQRALAGLRVEAGSDVVVDGRVLARRVAPLLGDWRWMAGPWCGVLWPSPRVVGVIVEGAGRGDERLRLVGRWFGVLGDRPVGVVQLGSGGGGVSRMSGALREGLREAFVVASGSGG